MPATAATQYQAAAVYSRHDKYSESLVEQTAQATPGLSLKLLGQLRELSRI